MKAFRIDSDTVDYFRGLDPFDTLDRLAMKGSFVLGSTDSSNISGEDEEEPTGLMVCTIETDRLVIHWLFVVPEYREMGLGSYLLMLAFEEADRRDLELVAARISDEYGIDDPTWDSWGFFVNDIFKVADEEGCVWRTNMKDIAKLLNKESRLDENAANAQGLIPLKDLSGKDLSDAAEKLNKRFAVSMGRPFEQQIYSADPEMSFLKKKKDDYVGAILMRKGINTWYMDTLLTEDEVDEETLFRAVLYYSEDYIKVGDRIEIEVESPSVEDLLDEIKMPGARYTVNYLTASVSDFRKMKKNAESE